MTVVERFIMIEAPVEFTSTIGMQPEYRLQWYDGMESFKPSDEYPQKGSTSSVVVKSAGVKIELQETILAYEAGKTIKIQLEGKILKGVTTWVYESTGDGKTKVSAHFDYKMAGGILGKMMNMMVVESANVKGLENSLKNLKKLVEQKVKEG
jgi:uncharacterized membrane protein